jgi:MFS family permease
MVGALISLWLMKHGRRITLYATTCCSAVCICLLVIENQWVILIGRFLLGFPMGFIAVSTGRLLEEFTPMHLFSQVFTILGFLTNGISALTMIIASQGMPDSKDIEGLKTTGYWRFFVGFPIIFCGIVLLILRFYLKHEPPKFLIS